MSDRKERYCRRCESAGACIDNLELVQRMARSIIADTSQPRSVKHTAYYVIGCLFFNMDDQPKMRVLDLLKDLQTKINTTVQVPSYLPSLHRLIIKLAQSQASLAAAFVLVESVANQHMRHTVHVHRYSKKDLTRWQTGVDVVVFPGGGVCVFDECAQINFATLLGVEMDPLPAIILE